ncbi:MAG: response regulator transcription factor [Chitinophagaceae bacterium]|nr:response regulator transcription factor [Chitinophagaceae bacterium]
MIKALILDDEQSAINTLQLMIERYVPEITKVKYSNEPLLALELIKTFEPDILFLDIQMPKLDGFAFLKQVKTINFTIIFTTAYDRYAIQAIRFSALDYLLKPIDASELQNAVKRFRLISENENNRKQLNANLLHNIATPDKKEFILAINTTQGTYFFKTEEIIRLEGMSNYTKIILINKAPLLASKTLKEYDEILAEHNFVRIHKSHLVNRKHVSSYNADGNLTMTDGSKVEISRRRQHEVIEKLKFGIN